MNKIFTRSFFSFIILICLAGCQDGNFRHPEPFNSRNCLKIKEYAIASGKKVLVRSYEYQDTSHVSMINHYNPDGQHNQSQFEYDSHGRLIRLNDVITFRETGHEYNGYITYDYDGNGNVSEIKGYKTVDGNSVLIQHMLIFYNSKNQVDRIISSFGTLTRLEYDDQGNVAKVYFTPYLGTEYLREEYSSYNTKSPGSLDKLLNLREVFANPLGSLFSKNQALAYKIYNPDGSLKEAHSNQYRYDRMGKYVRLTSFSAGLNQKSVKSVLEPEYKCW